MISERLRTGIQSIPPLAVLTMLSACASPAPKDNFRYELTTRIGATPDQLELIQNSLGHHDHLLMTRHLSNGNLECLYYYRFAGSRMCIYSLELDYRTQRFIGARIEGDDTWCIIVP